MRESAGKWELKGYANGADVSNHYPYLVVLMTLLQMNRRRAEVHCFHVSGLVSVVTRLRV